MSAKASIKQHLSWTGHSKNTSAALKWASAEVLFMAERFSDVSQLGIAPSVRAKEQHHEQQTETVPFFHFRYSEKNTFSLSKGITSMRS